MISNFIVYFLIKFSKYLNENYISRYQRSTPIQPCKFQQYTTIQKPAGLYFLLQASAGLFKCDRPICSPIGCRSKRTQTKTYPAKTYPILVASQLAVVDSAFVNVRHSRARVRPRPKCIIFIERGEPPLSDVEVLNCSTSQNALFPRESCMF